MKWVRLVESILGVLAGLLIIWFGVVLLILSRLAYDPGPTPVIGSVCIGVGVVVSCVSIFYRPIARSIPTPVIGSVCIGVGVVVSCVSIFYRRIARSIQRFLKDL